MPQSERMRVWKGELKRTSGGLTKEMLIKNKRGKIVSKKKSQAAKQNKDKKDEMIENMQAELDALRKQVAGAGLGGAEGAVPGCLTTKDAW